jgi:hypothetical protein
MKRALVAAGAVALVVAAPANARLPVYKSGSAVGEGLPFKAYASITPTVHLFGDAITAQLAVLADTKLVDPSRLQVNTNFAPYEPTKSPSVQQLKIGRFAQVTWTWNLACLTTRCVPRAPPSDRFHVFQFEPARIAYLRRNRTPAYSIDASWPPIEVLSQVSPGLVAFLQRTNSLNWRTGITPVAAPTYRFSPTLLLWLAVALAGVFGLAAVWFARREYLVLRPRRAAVEDVDSATALERALAVLRYAHEHGDETLQRKAFERVAGELGVERADQLARTARELAWSQRTPEDQEVEEFAQQASTHEGDE